MPAPPPGPADGGPLRALGLVETLGLVAAIKAADAMLKAADVRVVRQQRTVPGLVTHLVTGETAAVRAAVEAGAEAAARVGRVVATHVIPRPADDVWTRLVGVSLGSDAPGEADAARGGARVPASAVPAPEAPATSAPEAPASEAPASEAPASKPSVSDDLGALTVRELRARVRALGSASVSGRAVARASKDELLAVLRAAGA